MLIRILALCIGLILSGCVSVDAVIIDKTVRAPVSVDSISVLLESPAQDYKVVARVQVGPDVFVSDYEGQTKVLVKKAAELGADAVIVSYESSVSGYVGGSASGSVYGGTGESKYTVGVIIVYES